MSCVGKRQYGDYQDRYPGFLEYPPRGLFEGMELIFERDHATPTPRGSVTQNGRTRLIEPGPTWSGSHATRKLDAFGTPLHYPIPVPTCNH